MKVNFDSKTGIEELFEGGVPVLLESYCFTPFNKLKVTVCITSPPTTLSKHISILPMWKRILIQNYKDEISGPILLDFIQQKCDILITSDGSNKAKANRGEAVWF